MKPRVTKCGAGHRRDLKIHWGPWRGYVPDHPGETAGKRTGRGIPLRRPEARVGEKPDRGGWRFLANDPCAKAVIRATVKARERRGAKQTSTQEQKDSRSAMVGTPCNGKCTTSVRAPHLQEMGGGPTRGESKEKATVGEQLQTQAQVSQVLGQGLTL